MKSIKISKKKKRGNEKPEMLNEKSNNNVLLTASKLCGGFSLSPSDQSIINQAILVEARSNDTNAIGLLVLNRSAPIDCSDNVAWQQVDRGCVRDSILSRLPPPSDTDTVNNGNKEGIPVAATTFVPRPSRGTLT